MSQGTLANAVLSLTPNETHVDKEGFGVTISGDVATINASASVHHDGIIIDGEATTGKSSVMVFPGTSPVKVRLSGSVTKGAKLQQASDGTFVTDAATGSRVLAGRALQTGVTGENIWALLFNPIALS